MCIITPTHIGDLGQFSVLRRSINLFAPGFPQIAIVNTEDFTAFRDRFAGEAALEIVKSSDVLPRWIERRRRKSGPKWLTALQRLRGPLIKGWHAQQLMKLYALADCGYEAAAFFDSDVFICRPLSPEYFYVGDNLKLFRRRAPNAECLDFDIATHDIVGNPLHRITELYDYIYSPCCFRASSAARLFDEFRRIRRAWVQRFLAQKRPSEYHLLGYAATVLEGGAGYHIVECNPDDLHYSVRFPEDRARLAEEIERMKTEPKDFMLIQSSLKLRFEQISGAFDQVLEARRAPHDEARRAG